MQQNDEVYVLYIQVVLHSTFAVVTSHPQETHGDPRKQSSSSRQLLSSGDSPLPQDANRVPKEKQQQPLGQHSTGM